MLPISTFQALFASSPVAEILVSPQPEPIILAVNDAFLTIVSRKTGNFVGLPLFDVLPRGPAGEGDAALSALRGSLQRVLASGKPDQLPLQRYPISVRMPDGTDGIEMRYWSPISIPIFDAEGRLECISHRTIDITETKLLQDELMAQREASERALTESNRRKDEFLAMLAHELRNPLAPISAAAELMGMARLDEARAKRTSAVIRRQVTHMAGLLDDLLDVSRVTRGLITLEQTPQDLKNVVANAVEQVLPLIESQAHRLRIELPAEAVSVLGDQKRLVQVLTNLLNNAAKYTPPGGEISLSVQADGTTVCVHVKDTGIGICPDMQERVFELFEQGERTVDRTQGGLGLGLALVKSLAELHGGSVKCRSDGLGKGTCFTVCLPQLAGRPGDASSAFDPATIEPVRAFKRILVVDDNVDAAEMLRLLLEAAGHEVLVENDATRGLESARLHTPDVGLLDIGLPDMDGGELARRLRASVSTAGMKLIAVTGYGQEPDRRNAIDAGFDHHMAKPVNLAALMALIDAT
jgi:signal transduction histidine kinase